jgi:beta-phosphoglucomutase family hydrolase
MISAVIFDMDGVIVDSEPFHVQAEREVMERYGFDISEEELHRRYLGRTSQFMYQDLIDRYKLDVTDWHQLAEEKKDIFLPLLESKAQLIEGVLELIQFLHVGGMKLAIASSSRLHFIEIVMERFGLGGFFDVVVSADHIKHGKPHPEIFLKASDKLGCRPKECLVIEDAASGVAAAKSAGMSCLAFVPPGVLEQDLSKADHVFDSMKCILDYFV